MEWQTWVQAVALAILEGFTEFIPVSSTGHVLLAGHFLGFRSTGRTFEVLIQLGAILAVLWVYFGRLWRVAMALPHDRGAQRFVLSVLLAFLPAALLGVLAHEFIKGVLFETPWVICVMLILGGVVLMFLDRLDRNVRFRDAMQYPPGIALAIGIFQCLALVPGVSRSGATITAGLFLGMRRDAAARFSFLLSVPAIVLSGLYGLAGILADREGDDTSLLALAIATFFAFVSGYASIAFLLRYLASHSTMVFVVYRVALGVAALILAGAGVIE